MDLDSDSSLSSAPEEEVQKLAPIFIKAKKATKKAAPPPAGSPPRPKRAPSPPHEEVLADHPDIAFIVMFRSRFNDAFPSKTPHFGPQDIERGIVDTVPGPEIETLLCALLGLVLNRKKPVERGHHGRALEEAVASHKSQWPRKWHSQNPLHGGKTFESMSLTERLNLLHTLIMWSLSSSEAVSAIIKDRYKQQRHGDDENQPLSVQPWGLDGDRRRYFLIQGLDDSSFRVYREGNRYTKNAHWWSMAGTIDEVKALAERLDKEDGSQKARTLGVRMINAVPTFEATEEKRRRKEYRQQRRAAFSRPEPGYGIYEGRTRGKRMRYTYEDDDDAFASDATSTRRSTRQPSARSTPFEAAPTYTASGRQVKQRRTGEYGESLLSNHVMTTDELALEDENHSGSARAGTDESDQIRSSGRATRSRGARQVANGFNSGKQKRVDWDNSIDELSDEDEVDPSGDEWDSDRNDDARDDAPDADDEDSDMLDDDADDDLDAELTTKCPLSLIVKLKMSKVAPAITKETPPTSPPSVGEDASRTNQVGTTGHPVVRIPSLAAENESSNAGMVKREADLRLNGASDHSQGPNKILPIAADAPRDRSQSNPRVVIPALHPSQVAHYVPVVANTQNGFHASTTGPASENGT